MRSLLRVSAAALALCVAAPANAQLVAVAPSRVTLIEPVSGASYFNRPGATIADQVADLEACHPGVKAMSQPLQTSGAGASYGVIGALVEVGIASEMAALAERRALYPLYENCMVLRGWRVVRVSETLGAELDALEQPALAERLATMVGAETPEGEIARVFDNEIDDPNAILFGPPQRGDTRSLSLQALPPESSAYIAPPPTAAERNQTRRRPGSAAPTREEYEARRAAVEARNENSNGGLSREALREIERQARLDLVGPGEVARTVRPRDIARLPENATLLVVRVAGLGYGSGVILMRPGAEEGTVDMINPIVPTAFISGPKESTVVAVVPPGRWRLSGFNNIGGYVTSLCMGAPTFDIAEGEVVFAGSFAFGVPAEAGETPRLDMALDPARTALAAAPTLAAKLRAADYRNGDTFTCGVASNLYGYEVPGAPFLEGYRFGSRANVTPAPAAEPAATAPDTSEAAPPPT